jgi:ribosomal-protein-alanine N-acetyltransferase
MERMPFREDKNHMHATAAAVASSDWQGTLPVLSGSAVTLRELRTTDASSLFLLLTSEEVTRFISPPPSTVEGFERFIAWTHRQREAGSYACFAVTLKGHDTAIGLFQVRDLGIGFDTAEWGFAIGSPFWGTGTFEEAATLVLTFAFETLGIRRLEARAAVENGRGNGALRKIGAIPEGILRRTLPKGERFLDQLMYAILRDEWLAARLAVTPALH